MVFLGTLFWTHSHIRRNKMPRSSTRCGTDSMVSLLPPLGRWSPDQQMLRVGEGNGVAEVFCFLVVCVFLILVVSLCFSCISFLLCFGSILFCCVLVLFCFVSFGFIFCFVSFGFIFCFVGSCFLFPFDSLFGKAYQPAALPKYPQMLFRLFLHVDNVEVRFRVSVT